MATSLPIALNVRDGLKENYAYIALSPSPGTQYLWHKSIIHFALFCVLACHDSRKYHMQLPAKMQRLTVRFTR